MSQLQQWTPEGPIGNVGGIKAALSNPSNRHDLEMIMPGCNVDALAPRLLASIAGSPAADKIWKCTQGSLMICAINIVKHNLQVGGGPFAQAYIIPYGNVATLSVSYRGLRDIALSTGLFLEIKGKPIFENDIFDYYDGIEVHCRYTPAMRNKGELIGAYSIARQIDGTVSVQHSTIEDIEDFERAAMGDSPAWKNWKPQMGLKSTTKRHVGLLSLDPTKTKRLRDLIILDNENYNPSMGLAPAPEHRQLVAPEIVTIAAPAAEQAPEPEQGFGQLGPDLIVLAAEAATRGLRDLEGPIKGIIMKHPETGNVNIAQNQEALEKALLLGYRATFAAEPAAKAQEPEQQTIKTPPPAGMPEGSVKLSPAQLVAIDAAAETKGLARYDVEEALGFPLDDPMLDDETPASREDAALKALSKLPAKGAK